MPVGDGFVAGFVFVPPVIGSIARRELGKAHRPMYAGHENTLQ